MKCATSSILVALALLGAAPGEHAAADAPDVVILLHGLARTDRSMQPLEKRLRGAGFEVYNFQYASTAKAPEALVADLGRHVESCCSEAPALHFVGHSLGGILARAYLAQAPPENVGRVVMLAPPNHGSEIVDSLGDSSMFRSILGPSAQQLGTDPQSLPNRLPAPAFEVGVIAGTGSLNPIGSMLIPDSDDGIVSVESAKLEGMADFLEVPSSHTFIMQSSEVGDQVIRFLRTGGFQHETTE